MVVTLYPTGTYARRTHTLTHTQHTQTQHIHIFYIHNRQPLHSSPTSVLSRSSIERLIYSDNHALCRQVLPCASIASMPCSHLYVSFWPSRRLLKVGWVWGCGWFDQSNLIDIGIPMGKTKHTAFQLFLKRSSIKTL